MKLSEKIYANNLEEDKKEQNIKILDVFHQQHDDDIPAHWCVQYIKPKSSGFVEYQYFNTWSEANQYAVSHGYTN